MIFMYLFVSYMCIEWFILLHDLYSILARPIFQFIVATPTTTCEAALQHEGSHVTKFDNVQNGTGTGTGTGKNKALGVNPKTMMERLGTFWDPDDQRETIVLEEMVSLFVDDEPSLDEVKEAFSVFDKNNDGYIDAKELQNVLYGMGFLHISDRHCGTIIDGYDADKDGKISFRDFLKVVEDSFL